MIIPVDYVPAMFRMLGIALAGMFGLMSIAGTYSLFYQKPAPSPAKLVVILICFFMLGFLPNVWVALFTREVWFAKKKWRKNGFTRQTWLALLAIAYGMGAGFFLLARP
jgi:hypothetical protein